MNRFASIIFSALSLSGWTLFTGAWLCPAYADFESRDATIRACIVSTADRWWAVGDRGQALLTEDAGRRWEPAVVDGTPHFYAGIAIDSRKGVLVGGRIQPYSHRSVGTVQVTRDGGRRWRAIDTPNLPRLTGIQMIATEHWIAWGDWSPVLGSAIFETRDAGVTWSGKPLAASHVQTSAWENSESGIVIDRLSRVFRIEGGKEPQLLSVGSDASNPILQAKYDASGWWLIGESAQIYHSFDGYHWQLKTLPGTPTDRALIRLNDIAFQTMPIGAIPATGVYGNDLQNSTQLKNTTPQTLGAKSPPHTRCWVAGSPGNVVWMSDDLGTSWKVQLTSQHLPIYSIAHAGDSTLLAGGKLGTLIGTRNGGEGWWTLGREGERVALLSIAAIQETVPWDALAVTARESRAHAVSIVLHNQRIYQLAGPWCENQSRASIMAAELGFAGVETFTHSPLRSHPGNRTLSELNIYDTNLKSNLASELHIKKIVSQIRQHRPDVLICDSLDAKDPIVQHAGRAVMTARNRASDSRYACFSKESGIPDGVWDSKTLLARAPCNADSNRRRSEFRFSSTTPIHREGTLLSDLLISLAAMVDADKVSNLKSNSSVSDSDSMLPWNHYGEFSVLQGPRPAGGKNGLLPEAVRQIGSMRPQNARESVAYRELIVNLQRESTIKKIVELEVEDSTNDLRWKSALQNAMKSTAREARSHSLWHIAQEARARLQWQRWLFCLDILIGEYSTEGVAELAALQRSAWGSSSEVTLWRQQQETARASQVNNSNVISASYVTTSSSSPFDHRTHLDQTPNDSMTFANEARQPSRSTLQGQSAVKVVNPVSNASNTESVEAKITGMVPRAMTTSFASTVSTAFQRMANDPRMILLGLRRQSYPTSETNRSKSAEFPSPVFQSASHQNAALRNESHNKDSYASHMAALNETLRDMSEWYGLYGWSTLADDEYLSRMSKTAFTSTENSNNFDPNPTVRPNNVQPSSFVIPNSGLRPILDGSLEDTIWSRAFHLSLGSMWDELENAKSEKKRTRLSWAHDDRFLYISGVCPTISMNGNSTSTSSMDTKTETQPESLPLQRLHDETILAEDRICIRIDTDRDFSTCFQFTIDAKGNLEDSLNDLKGWNPRWYATSVQASDAWNFEIAIPLSELMDDQQLGMLNASRHGTPSVSNPPSSNPVQDPLGEKRVVWNISVDRETPGKPTDMSKPLFVEDFSPLSWRTVLVE